MKPWFRIEENSHRTEFQIYISSQYQLKDYTTTRTSWSSSYVPLQTSYVPLQTSYVPLQTSYVPFQTSYIPLQNIT